jgi:PTS system N-acetylglucosamine-specific IIC component
MLGFLQRIGKALMLPIAVLPAAALLLRLGKEDMLDIPFMEASGNAIMAQLPLIFAIGVAIGLAKDSNGAAALAGAIGYFVLVGGTQAIDKHNDMAVFAGLIAGTVAGLLYNRYHNIQLPQWLGFFGGKRFVPIITAGSMLVLAGIFGYVWPPIQSFIDGIGQYLIDLGALGAGIFGVLNRLLIPVGLHHILNNIVWFLFGEYNGERGDIARFFAGDPTAGTFMTGFFSCTCDDCSSQKRAPQACNRNACKPCSYVLLNRCDRTN